MDKLIKCLAIFIILFVALCVKAQDDGCPSCNCHRPDYHAPIGVMIDHGHKKGEVMISYRLINTFKKGNQMGTEKIDDDKVYQSYLMSPAQMNIQMHMLMVMYGLSDKITLMGMMDYMHHTMDMSMMDGQAHMAGMNMSDMDMSETTKSSGFGDAKLFVLYTIMENEDQQLLLSAGINLPTGSISRMGSNMLSDNQRLTYSMQPGTGTFSLLPGITYMRQGKSFSWGTQFLSDIKTGANKEGYQLGNEYVFNSWLAHSWNNWLGNSLRINGDALGKIKGYDAEIASYRNVDPDADSRNSGGYRASIFAGLNAVIPQGTFAGNRFGLELGFPFYQNLNGVQMSTKLFVNAGWQCVF